MAPHRWVSMQSASVWGKEAGQASVPSPCPFNVIPQTEKITWIDCGLAVFLVLGSTAPYGHENSCPILLIMA